ncbi:MAG: hypothetical protein K0A93_06425 [Desulfuromonadaceae bacterium]|nr:hypothetical protein [Desulfuromonadaceae bacterium]
MVFDVSIVITWLLFLSLFPMAFIWLRRAWRIFFKHDYSEVALKRGEAPPNPKRWAPATGIVNLAAGSMAVFIIVGVVLALFPYKVWSTLAGSTLWIKIFADYIVSRQAHPFMIGKNKKDQTD